MKLQLPSVNSVWNSYSRNFKMNKIFENTFVRTWLETSGIYELSNGQWYGRTQLGCYKRLSKSN